MKRRKSEELDLDKLEKLTEDLKIITIESENITSSTENIISSTNELSTSIEELKENLVKFFFCSRGNFSKYRGIV